LSKEDPCHLNYHVLLHVSVTGKGGCKNCLTMLQRHEVKWEMSYCFSNAAANTFFTKQQ